MKKSVNKKKSMKLDALRFGLAGGIVSALCVGVSTILGLFGYYQIHNSMIIEMYGMIGYGQSWVGVLIGSVYGFVDGFFIVWIFALIYNWLLRKF